VLRKWAGLCSAGGLQRKLRSGSRRGALDSGLVRTLVGKRQTPRGGLVYSNRWKAGQFHVLHAKILAHVRASTGDIETLVHYYKTILEGEKAHRDEAEILQMFQTAVLRTCGARVLEHFNEMLKSTDAKKM